MDLALVVAVVAAVSTEPLLPLAGLALRGEHPQQHSRLSVVEDPLGSPQSS